MLENPKRIAVFGGGALVLLLTVSLAWHLVLGNAVIDAGIPEAPELSPQEVRCDYLGQTVSHQDAVRHGYIEECPETLF